MSTESIASIVSTVSAPKLHPKSSLGEAVSQTVLRENTVDYVFLVGSMNRNQTFSS